MVAERVRRALERILPADASNDCVVWAHNMGLGRNLPLARELARISNERGLPLVLHHHDWWFENRWARWPEMRRSGGRTLREIAQAMFPQGDKIRHAAINQADAGILRRRFGRAVGWLPNPVSQAPAPGVVATRSARAWLQRQLGDDAPVWLLPCRLLRRKNIAEALLLTRWLRPEAWLVTTGGISSKDEQEYGNGLVRAAKRNGWRLRMSVLAGDESRKPTVPELLAASEAVLLTSIAEGFGLPYLEAAVARRPLIARALPNVAPDLRSFGFRFPQSYDDVLIHPDLFNWQGEVARQAKLFARWKSALPRARRASVGKPMLLAARAHPRPVPFSRLTLSAQLEVLEHSADLAWKLCVPLNPFLTVWRCRARAGKLKVSPWPSEAGCILSGEASALRFTQLLAQPAPRHRPQDERASATLDEFINTRLAPHHLFPLLWAEVT